jgi:hypothetical protein
MFSTVPKSLDALADYESPALTVELQARLGFSGMTLAARAKTCDSSALTRFEAQRRIESRLFLSSNHCMARGLENETCEEK